MHHHAYLIFVFRIFVVVLETGFCVVVKADTELSDSNDPPVLASQHVRIIGMSYYTQPR